jgi:hypothetical protein
LKISVDKCDLKLQEASQVGEVAKESRGEILFFISWITQGRTDNRNPLRRFCEVSRIVRSCRGARRLRREDSEEFEAQERQSRRFRVTGVVRSTRGIVYQGCATRMTISRGVISLQDQNCSLWRTHVGRFSHLVDSVIGEQRGKSFSFVSHEVPRAGGLRGHVAEHKVAPAWSMGGHMLPGDRSQHSVEFAHLGDLRNRRVKARWFNLRGGEVARLRVVKSIEGGVNSALTYRISEDRNGRYKSSTHKLTKVRVARGANI